MIFQKIQLIFDKTLKNIVFWSLFGLLCTSFGLHAQTTVNFLYSPKPDEADLKGSLVVSVIVKHGNQTTRLPISNNEVTINLNQFENPIVSFELSGLTVTDYRKSVLEFASVSTVLPGMTLASTDLDFLKKGNTVKILYKVENKSAQGAFSLEDLVLDCNHKKIESKVPVSINGKSRFQIRYNIYPKKDAAEEALKMQKELEEKNKKEAEELRKKEEEKRLREKARIDSLALASSQRNIINPEESAWNEALVSNTLDAFSNFLKSYPTSKYKPEAEKRIKRFKAEEREWKALATSENLKDFEKFLKNYPESKYKEQVLKLMEVLKTKLAEKPSDEDAWKKVSVESFEQLYNYTQNYPDGKHLSEAVSALKNTMITYNPADSVRSENGGIVYKIHILNVWDGSLTVSVTNGENLSPSVSASGGSVEIEILVKPGVTASISIQDSLGRTTKEPISLLYGQKRFSLSILHENEGGNMVFEIEGGIPPYAICIKQNGVIKRTFDLSGPPYLLDLSQIEAGNYEVVAIDSKKTYETDPLTFTKPKGTPWKSILLIALGVLALIGGVAGVLISKNKRKGIKIGRRENYS